MMIRIGTLAVACLLSTISGTGPRIARAHAVAVIPARADSAEDPLVTLEKRSWVAWQAHDTAFYRGFLSDDHLEVGFGGVGGKAYVIASVGSAACTVTSYTHDHFRVTYFDSLTAAVTYRASQATTCGGKPVPSPVWASSIYVRRGGRWLNAVYQQTANPQ